MTAALALRNIMNTFKDINIHLENKRKSRLFFAFLFLLYALVYMTKNCFGSALADIVSEGVLTKSQTGLITSAFYLVYAPLQIVGGIVTDRYNPERLITVGLLGGAIANGIIFFNHNFYVMLIAWSLNAASQFALWPGVFKIISSQLVRSDRSQMVFLISFSSATGLLLGYVTAAFIPAWNWNFAISSIVLFLLAIALYVVSRVLSPDMKPDAIEKPAPVPDTTVSEGAPATSTMRLFVMSGLWFVFVISLLRMVIAQGIQTLSPTLLMESYESVTPRIGNLLQTFILASGMLGTLLARTVLYPKYIRHEIRGQLWFYLICLPLSVLLLFVGRISLWLAIPSLCIILIAISACALLIQYYNIYFIPYGKNGTVAGIINAGASFGVVIANYGSLALADNFGWVSVIIAWSVMIVLTIACVLLALRPTTRFREQVRRIWRA